MEAMDAGLAGSLLKTAVSGRGSRGVALDEGDGRRGRMMVEERDGRGWKTVDVRDVGGRLIRKREMSGVAEVVKGDGSRPLIGGGAPWETTGRGRRRVAGDGVGTVVAGKFCGF